MKKKKRGLLIGILLILFISFSVVAIPVLTQEDNTFSVLSGIVKLTLGKSDIIKYDHDESFGYYITKSELGVELIKSLLLNDGWLLSEQMGAGYIFVKETDNSTRIIVNSRQFTGNYKVWIVPVYNEG